jgi:hypothetical protein
MTKEFIPYEQALALKGLGFDEPCFGRYYYKESYPMLNPNSGETELVFEFGQYIKQTEITILAPLYRQAFKFFREKKIQSTIQEYDFNNYMYLIDDGINRDIEVMGYNSYEEAEIECLKKLIEIVKEKK